MKYFFVIIVSTSKKVAHASLDFQSKKKLAFLYIKTGPVYLFHAKVIPRFWYFCLLWFSMQTTCGPFYVCAHCIACSLLLFWRVAIFFWQLQIKKNPFKMKWRHSPKIHEKVASSLSWSKIWYYIFSLLAGFNSNGKLKRLFVLYYPFWLDKRGKKIRNV